MESLVIGGRIGNPQIVADRADEDRRVLGQKPDMGMQVRLAHVADIDAGRCECARVSTSTRRSSRPNNVDLPEPLSPMMAIPLARVQGEIEPGQDRLVAAHR